MTYFKSYSFGVKECSECGTIFQPEHPASKICSDECRRVRQNKATRKCYDYDKRKDYRVKYEYGIDRDTYEEIMSRGCEICSSEVNLHLDHCHETGKVRGCLCMTCNLAIGKLGDNVRGLRKALKYLEKEYG